MRYLLFLSMIGCVFSSIAAEELRAPKQAVLPPAEWKAVEVWPDAPKPFASAAEKRSGMILFSRPLTDPVYPESRPRDFERVEKLSSFGAPGQFVTFHVAVYPLNELKNLRVEWNSGVPGAREETRLVTYWKTRYPMYTSVGSFRELPEYLFPVTVNDAPAEVPQRYFLTVRIPEKAKAGVVRGEARFRSDASGAVVKLPVELEVLPFRLKKDPNKHYSAYQTAPSATLAVRKKGPEFVKKVFERELRTMADYGFDRAPRQNLSYDMEKKEFRIGGLEEMIGIIRELGFDETLPVTGCGVYQLYQKYTGKKMLNHHRYPQEPPEAMYDELDRALAAWRRECDRKGYPRMVMGPLDEVDGSGVPLARRVYSLFKKHGFDTFTTKDPVSDRSAAELADVIDIWSSQPYSYTFEEVRKLKRKAYWCYPNHNSYEIKNPAVMCKGGRMTYGYGNFRSGYDFLMPWIWRNRQDDFTSPAPAGSSGGNWVAPDGSIVMTTYWESFRAGIDDARYIYTLQDAVVKRENSPDLRVKKLVAEAKGMLRELWEAIPVRRKYLDEGLWPSAEFDARRYQLAKMTEKLLRYPAADPERISPSVLVAPPPEKESDRFAELCREGLADGSIEKLVLDPASSAWRAVEQEASVSYDPQRKLDGRKSIRLTVKVDHKRDGSGEFAGKYPMNWPRIGYRFEKAPVDLERYDFISLYYKVQSNRNETKNARTPFWSVVQKVPNSGSVTVDEVFPEGVVHHKVRPVRGYFGTSTAGTRKKVSEIQFGVNERSYDHGDELTFDFADVSLLRLKSPKFLTFSAPGVWRGNSGVIGYETELIGALPAGVKLRATLRDAQERIVASGSFDPDEKLAVQVGGFSVPECAPGRGTLTVELILEGKVLHRLSRKLEII